MDHQTIIHMKKHLNKFIVSIIICITTTNYLIAQSNDNLNLLRFKQSDYDILQSSDLFPEIDFYNANEITFYRELRGDEVTATNGVLKIINNIRYEYIILPKRNVGRFYSTSGYNDLRISFDSRHPEKSLKFDMRQSHDGINLFYLTTTVEDDKDAVSYAGEVYFILTGPGFSNDGTNYVFLLYDNTKDVNKATEVDTLQSFPSRRKNN